MAVCYEAVFPWLSRAAVRQGSQLLATITNDAWYGTSAAPYQHFQQARVRAVETGRYLVRAANTGISGVVDPYGRVQVQSPLFETGTWTGDVRWLDGVDAVRAHRRRRGLGLYARHGGAARVAVLGTSAVRHA